MTQYLLAPYREYAVSIPPEQTQQVSADDSALANKLTNAGAFGFKSRLLAGDSATAARRSGGETS